MGVLDGIKVLELARVPPAEMPGMFFADMGADVLKIETPPEHPEDAAAKRRAAFVYVNRNKRSLALNLKAPEGQALFRRLAAGADVIVEGFRPGVMKRLGADYETIKAINPRIVYCSLSGFGHNGPYRDYPAHDGNYLSLAGVLGLIGEPDRKPVFPLNIVADYAGASMHGALGVMMALFARERTGRGQHVDVSYLDTSVALLAATPNMRFFWSDGQAPKRGEGFLGGSYPYYAVYETKDGKLLTIGCTEPWLWANFCKAIDRPDFVRFARQPDQFVRAANAEEVACREAIEAIIKTRPRDEWYEILVKADVCVGKVYTPEEMAQDPQVRARDMIVEMHHPEHGVVTQFGQPIKLSDTPAAVRTPSPATGEHTDEILRGLGMSEADVKALRDKKIVASTRALVLLLAALVLAAPAPAAAALLSWSSQGPDTGHVTALAVDPQAPGTVYAGVAGRGVFKTINGGLNWNALNVGITPEAIAAGITALAVTRTGATTVYAGTAGQGVFKSADDGASWSSAIAGLQSLTINDIAVDPTIPSRLYAATPLGVSKSDNAGLSWITVNNGLITAGVQALAIDPVTPTFVYAGTVGAGVFRSDDAAASWVPKTSGLASNLSIRAIAVDPLTPATLYASTDTNGVYKTTTRGEPSPTFGWTRANNGLTSAVVIRLVVSPVVPSTVYAATVDDGVFKTIDAAGSWAAVNSGLGSTELDALALDPSVPDTLYAGTPGGAFKSANAAAAWAPASNGFTGSVSVASLAVDPQAPATVYAGTTIGAFKSVTGGTSWFPASNGLVDASVTALAIDPQTPSTVYAGVAGDGVFRSTDGGGSWIVKKNGLTNLTIQSLVIHPQAPAIVYAGTVGGVFKTVNGGESWTAFNTNLTSLSVRSLAIDPQTPQILYAGTANGGVFKTTNGGDTWAPATAGLPTSIRSVALNPQSPSTVYAGTADGIFRSTDGGQSWSAASIGISETSIRSVVVDPLAPAVLYAGTSGGGVSRSADGGLTWTPLLAGLTDDDVRALAISPSGACVHAGTFAGGVFDFATAIEPCTGLIPPLVAAVLPSSRSVQVGTPATAFAAVINPGPVTAESCGIALADAGLAATFFYQTTDPATNQLTGTPNTPVDVPGFAVQTYLITVTPTDTIRSTEVPFTFNCSNTATSTPVIVGVNTLLLVASNGPVPDVIALAAAPGGIVSIPGPNGVGLLVVATVNVGAAGTMRVTADTGSVTLPMTLLICETDPITSICKEPLQTSVQRGIGTGQTPTFAIFAFGSGGIGFDPALNRIFVRFKDGSGVTRGSTSVAVRTE